jgi:quinol monooxygenase YgiN
MPIVLPTLPDAALDETGPIASSPSIERNAVTPMRAEPGALQFHIHRNRFDRDLFVIYEVWRDVDALRAHFERAYVQQFVVDSV